jgi:hypothetical protein
LRFFINKKNYRSSKKRFFSHGCESRDSIGGGRGGGGRPAGATRA